MEELRNTLIDLINLTDEVYEACACNNMKNASEKALIVIQSINDLLPQLIQNKIKVSSIFIEDLNDCIAAIQEYDVFKLLDRMKYAVRLDLEKIVKEMGVALA